MSENGVLEALERLGSRIDGLRETMAGSFAEVRSELREADVATRERLTRLETDRERWFADTWPNAQRVIEAQDDRVRALEQSQVTEAALNEMRKSMSDRMERQEARLVFLEHWRWKMVGMAAGIGLCTGVIGWLGAKAFGL